MSGVARIIDGIKDVAAKQDSANRTYLTTATALSSGATRIKLDRNGMTIDGSILYRAKTVEHLESGKRVIVAVSDGGNAYYVIDELL